MTSRRWRSKPSQDPETTVETDEVAAMTALVGRRHALRVTVAGATAALGALVLGGRRTERVSAADNPTTFLTSGSDASPAITATDTSTAAPAAISATSNQAGSPAILGSNTGSGFGIQGQASASSTTTAGVVGENAGTAAGVLGHNTNTTGGNGVKGLNANVDAAVWGNNTGTGAASGNGARGTAAGTQAGVFGTNTNAAAGSGNGVHGTAAASTANGVLGVNTAGGTGVLGKSTGGTSDNSVGVYGTSASTAAGIGVLGLASNDSQSVGVYGQSATGTGFLGFSNATGGVGASIVNSTSGIGLYAESNGGLAGDFKGNVYITGNLTVVGSFPKSAAVRGADGGLKRLYCVESPECWFEDFGTARLKSGTATVEFEPGFAEVVKTDDYRVFPVAQGDCKGLYVSHKSAAAFTVREVQGGTSDISFDYRVVARRKDIAGERLEKVDEPAHPKLPPVPRLP
jgi:hypothetical protein